MVSPPLNVRNGEPGPRRAFLKGAASAWLLSGFGSTLLSACGGGGISSNVPDTPRLASVNNFRDIGGAGGGYPTVDGRQVRRGMFYRSNALTLSPADKAVIDTLNIASVYDLRTPGETSRSADVMPTGAVYVNINVLGQSDQTVPPPDLQGGAMAWMEAAERAYVTGTAQRAGYGSLLTQLASADGVQLIHSQAGKDRTGWVAAILLSIANVPLDIIMQDYLLTNAYAAETIKVADRGGADTKRRRCRHARRTALRRTGEFSAGWLRPGASELRHDDKLPDHGPGLIAIHHRRLARPACRLGAPVHVAPVHSRQLKKKRPAHTSVWRTEEGGHRGGRGELYVRQARRCLPGKVA